MRRCDQDISIIGTIDGLQTAITAVYGSNSGGTRRGLWEHLRTVENEFQDCLEELDLMDHHFLGPTFTWSNRQEGSFLARKLDRILVNTQWLLDYPDSFMEFKAQGLKTPGKCTVMKGKRSKLEQIQIFNLTHVEQRRVDEEKRVYDELVNLERVESNKKRNTIRVIKGEDGQFYDTFEGMAAELVSFFTNLIGVEDPLVKSSSIEDLKASYLLPAFNATAIVLVPKSLNACLAKEFRPISCCSVVYKTITRILVNRLAHFFPSMISLSQSAFLKGMNIVDNTLLAHEIIKGYSRKSLSPRCAIKVDLQKAFDSVCWDFLLKVLVVMGLPCTFCNWIKDCITTPMFSLSLNGSLVVFFKGARGIRQGDLLSPYLFILAMNVLSSLLDAAAKHGIFKFHPKCRRISLTHLCFADDLLVFCHGSLGAIILDTGFRVGQLPVRYRGVPLVTRKLTGKDCEALLTKIKDKLRIWSNKNLSYGGSDLSAKGARVGWSQICSLKSEGGLGLRSLVMWNKACCFLLIKNILANEGSLWIAWINEYCFNWGDIFNWLIANLKGKSLRVHIMKLAWTGLLYFVWEERNHRLFRGSSRSVDVVVNSIKEDVRVKLCRFGCPRIEDVNRHLYLNWGLS
ncbi:uncharacterized protein LOC120138638 [Hibiscus syriacus]|uniref:uncharacterized protein LOC120138638 n=1 Tax=Hibiscus syriacus TaxID=106335 RepID=UPI001922E185|nr:uncharacterized protein LOC120138638 [Hibiscus syriacus]